MDTSLPSILHAIDTTGPGGAETVFLDLTENLTLEGYRSFAVIKGPGWVEDQLKARGIQYYIVKPKGSFSFSYYRKLFRIIRENNVKLIQAHLLGSTLTYSIIALLLRIPLVATLHGKVDVNPNERLIFIKNLIMKLGVKRLIAVSRDLANYIETRGLFNKGKIRVIYNGVDVKDYRKSNLNEIRLLLKLDKQAILVGSVGNIRPAKAYDVLIKAAKEVITHNRNIHFVIAGHKKPELMQQLEDLMDKVGVSQHVHFIGFQQPSAAFFSQMDLFTLSSSSEGFSISTIEAMATGLAAVVTCCGGPEEIITHKTTGWLVPVNDPQALASGILTVLNDPNLQCSLAQKGQLHITENFSLDFLIKQYQTLYEELLVEAYQ